MIHLIEPHGGQLCELLVSDANRKKLQEESLQYPSLTLNDRQLCDVEMLLNGGFSPLKGFLSYADYESVLEENRLSENVVWQIPCEEGLVCGCVFMIQYSKSVPKDRSSGIILNRIWKYLQRMSINKLIK